LLISQAHCIVITSKISTNQTVVKIEQIQQIFKLINQSYDYCNNLVESASWDRCEESRFIMVHITGERVLGVEASTGDIT